MTSELKFYFKIFLRRMPVMLVLIALTTSLAAVIALRLPAVYSTSATLLVERAQISERVVGLEPSLGAAQQLGIVQRRLMTRANLLEVARSNEVFANISQMSPDEIVEAMRTQTRIARARGKNAEAAMTISFEGANPRKVAQVVNEYVTIVLATSADVRTTRAQGQLDFFVQEVQTLSENIDLQGQKIVEFKSANAQALPENLDYRLNRQSLLQERISRAERDLETLQTQRANVVRVYETTGGIQSEDGVVLTQEQRELQQLGRELNAALTVYSETNPKVRLLRNRITVLESQIAAQAASVVVEVQEERPQSAAEAALEISLAEIDARMTSLQNDRDEISAELISLQDTIVQTPQNGITLEAMQRDLENFRQLHSAAIQRLNQARMGERVEVSAKGDRITLLEPASTPNEPSSPNRMMIIGGGFGIGLMLSVGLFILLELMTQAIRRPSEIEKKLDFSPLAILPEFEVAAHRRWRRIGKLGIILVVCAALAAGIVAVDLYYMRLEEVFDKIVSLVR